MNGSDGKFRAKSIARAALLLLAWVSGPAAGQAPATRAAEETSVAPGVVYWHQRSTTPGGEPWSIHVLEVERGEKSVLLRSVAGHSSQDEMRRQLPSEMAARAAREGADLLAVVNGDLDLSEPHLGIPVGLSVTSGRLWTADRTGRPVLGLLTTGEPMIAAPELTLELSARKTKWAVAAVNKPLGFAAGEGPRLYSREHGAALKSRRPFRAVVIGRLAPALPLRVDGTVRGVVMEVFAQTSEVAIPANALVLTERGATARATANPPGTVDPKGTTSSIGGLRTGEKVKLRIGLRLGGKKGVREAIGGFPILVENGQQNIVGRPSEYLRLRHPRTAACYSDRKIIFVVVDGRQPKLSVGMTLQELSKLMVSLGCTVAINADGGGSSVMAVALPFKSSTHDTGASRPPASGLKIVNSPSDGQERGRGNAWLVLRRH